MKRQLLLKILLPILVISLIVLIMLEIKDFDWHNDDKDGLIFVISILLNIIPMLAMIICGLATVIVFILLLTLKDKAKVIVGTLIILCILLPFAAFSVFVDIAALYNFIEVPIFAVVVFALDLASTIICCLEINESRKKKQN